MTSWAIDEVSRIGAARELTLRVRRADGTLRDPVPIWVVRVGDELYVRSWRGAAGRWYAALGERAEARIEAGDVCRDVRLLAADPDVDDDVDAVLLAKYRTSSYARPMVAPQARATTRRIEPLA